MTKSASSICLRKMYSACGEKPPFFLPPQNFCPVTGLHNDPVRRDVERLRIDFLQRTNHRRHQIRATANRFGQDHIRTTVLCEPFDGIGQFVEVATKTGTCDLANVESLRTKNVRIHQIRRLVVGDDDDLFSLRLESTGKSGNGGGFAGAQKTADHDKTGIVSHGNISLLVSRVASVGNR